MSLPGNSSHRGRETGRAFASYSFVTTAVAVITVICTCLPIEAHNLPVSTDSFGMPEDARDDIPQPRVDAADSEIPQLSTLFADRVSAIDVQTTYYGDVFGKTHGGASTKDAIRYQGLLNIELTVDLDALDALENRIPGRVYLLGQTTHGQGLSHDIVGDSLVLSDIDSGGNITQVGEFWWELQLLDENVTVRLGKQDVNTEFIYIDAAEHFVQSSFELTPSSTLPTFPQQSMAAVVLLQLNSSLQLKLGAWDALAEPGGWGVSGNDTAFLASEVEYQYALNDGRLPGTISTAAGYQTPGEFNDQPVDAIHGYAFQWEQLLFRESCPDSVSSQGLSVFAAYYPRFFGSNRPPNSIGNSASAGIVYQGLLSRRDDDEMGVGVSWAELFQGGSNREIVYEIFYRAEINSRVSLQPDLQYIISPSGIYPDAFVAGVRFLLEL
ncbi:MAG: carbohydrate porin [Planctomyces sp.]|nr:carbohydrate porin [Planctomyces sp.]